MINLNIFSYGWAAIVIVKIGATIVKESFGHFFSNAGNVITTFSCAFDKSQ